jgi:hypothetical protein
MQVSINTACPAIKDIPHIFNMLPKTLLEKAEDHQPSRDGPFLRDVASSHSSTNSSKTSNLHKEYKTHHAPNRGKYTPNCFDHITFTKNGFQRYCKKRRDLLEWRQKKDGVVPRACTDLGPSFGGSGVTKRGER